MTKGELEQTRGEILRLWLRMTRGRAENDSLLLCHPERSEGSAGLAMTKPAVTLTLNEVKRKGP